MLYDGMKFRCIGFGCESRVQGTVQELARKTKTDVNKVDFGSVLSLTQQLDDAIANLKPGDQFLLSFFTHGAPAGGKYQHSICTSEGFLIDISSAKITSRLEKLKAKGVKLGFIDSSCYSGGSIPILSKYGCVLSLTTEHNTSASDYIFANIVNMPASTLKNGGLKNDGSFSLEDLFITHKDQYANPNNPNAQDRGSRSASNFPQISGFQKGNSYSEFFSIARSLNEYNVSSLNQVCSASGLNFTELDHLSSNIQKIIPNAMQVLQECKNVLEIERNNKKNISDFQKIVDEHNSILSMIARLKESEKYKDLPIPEFLKGLWGKESSATAKKVRFSFEKIRDLDLSKLLPDVEVKSKAIEEKMAKLETDYAKQADILNVCGHQFVFLSYLQHREDLKNNPNSEEAKQHKQCEDFNIVGPQTK